VRSPKAHVIVTSAKIAGRRAVQIPQVHEPKSQACDLGGRKLLGALSRLHQLADANGHPIRDDYVNDLLHLSPAGYAKWKEILDPLLRKEWTKANQPEFGPKLDGLDQTNEKTSGLQTNWRSQSAVLVSQDNGLSD
jgi:hypothetical protein